MLGHKNATPRTIDVARGGPGARAPKNRNATNHKNVTKNLSHLQSQFLLAFFAHYIHAYNSNEQ